VNPTGIDQMTKQGVDSTLNLTVYGPLGVLALLAIVVAVKLYLDHRKDRRDWQIQLDAERQKHLDQLTKERTECQNERAQHQIEMHKLEERYIAKAENALEKYHALAESLNRVLDSASRRYPRNSGGNSGQTGDGGG